MSGQDPVIDEVSELAKDKANAQQRRTPDDTLITSSARARKKGMEYTLTIHSEIPRNDTLG